MVLSVIVLLNATILGYVVQMLATFKTVCVRLGDSQYCCTSFCNGISLARTADEVCMRGAVRLVGGVTNSSGLLEVCVNGVWGTVCDYLEEWNYENVAVVCQQLHLPTSGQ